MKELNNSLFLRYVNFHVDVSEGNYLIETVSDSKKEVEFAKQLMPKMVLALRLLKDENVFGVDVICFNCEDDTLTRNRFEPLPSEDNEVPNYILTTEEIPALKELITKLTEVDFQKRKSLDLACVRFQRAYFEYHDDDKLLDYMIAFEALFLEGEHTEEKNPVISIACSTLLGHTHEERKNIKDTMKVAYQLRNSIVHGFKFTKKINRFSIVESTKDYLKQAIIKFLD